MAQLSFDVAQRDDSIKAIDRRRIERNLNGINPMARATGRSNAEMDAKRLCDDGRSPARCVFGVSTTRS